VRPVPHADESPGPEGTIGHAELEIGDSLVMLSDPTLVPPSSFGGRVDAWGKALTGKDYETAENLPRA